MDKTISAVCVEASSRDTSFDVLMDKTISAVCVEASSRDTRLDVLMGKTISAGFTNSLLELAFPNLALRLVALAQD